MLTAAHSACTTAAPPEFPAFPSPGVLLDPQNALRADGEEDTPSGDRPQAADIPTAEQLSQPGALQAYVDARLAATGECRLPRGVIRISQSNPLVIRKIQGGAIRGVGMPYTTHDQKSGWNGKHEHTTRLVSTDGTGIVWGPVLSTTLANFSIEDGTVGILYPHEKGWGSALNLLERIAFIRCGVGLQAGERASDGNCADLVLRSCHWRRCPTGVLIKNDQGVNLTFESLCNWHYCGIAIHIERGGQLSVRDGLTYGGETFIRIDHGGGGMPVVIDRLSFDRKPLEDPLPRIVDATRAAHGFLQIDVQRLKVNAQPGEGKDGNSRFFVMPKQAKSRDWQSIRVGPVATYASKKCVEVAYE